MIADTAGRALMLPGLSWESQLDLREVWAGARIAAGQPCEPHQRRGDGLLPA